jgi:hypothetical protein
MIKIYQKNKNVIPAFRVTPAQAGVQTKITLFYLWRAIIERKILVLSLLFLLVTLPILYLVIKYQSNYVFSGRGTSGFFVEGNPHQKKSNNNKSSKNHYVGVYPPKFTHFSNSPSILTVNNKNRIPTSRWNVNSKNSLIVFGAETVTPAKAVIKAAAEKLINNPEKAFNQEFVKNLGIKNSLTNKNFVVNKI